MDFKDYVNFCFKQNTQKNVSFYLTIVKIDFILSCSIYLAINFEDTELIFFRGGPRFNVKKNRKS